MSGSCKYLWKFRHSKGLIAEEKPDQTDEFARKHRKNEQMVSRRDASRHKGPKVLYTFTRQCRDTPFRCSCPLGHRGFFCANLASWREALPTEDKSEIFLIICIGAKDQCDCLLDALRFDDPYLGLSALCVSLSELLYSGKRDQSRLHIFFCVLQQ